MFELETLEVSATLREKNSVDAMAQSRREESIMTAMYLVETELKWQKFIGTARLFIDHGGPLSCIGRHSANWVCLYSVHIQYHLNYITCRMRTWTI